jgi:hypothetical protein
MRVVIPFALLGLVAAPALALAGQHGHGGAGHGHAGKGDRDRNDHSWHVAPNHTRTVGPATSGERGHLGVLTGNNGPIDEPR